MDKSFDLRRKMFKRDVVAEMSQKSPVSKQSGERTVKTPTSENFKEEVEERKEDSTWTDAIVDKGSRTRSRDEKPDSGTSFCDHLQSLNEEYREEIISKDRQLREERNKSQMLRIEYLNYKSSYLREKAKVKAVEGQLYKRDLELNRLKMTLNAILKENEALRKKARSESSPERSSVEDGQDILPMAPCQDKGRGRPYTGKSRDGCQLPPITKNNKVVISPSSTSTHVIRSGSIETSTTPFGRKFAPEPPKDPRPPKPSNRSRIPRALPPIRRAS